MNEKQEKRRINTIQITTRPFRQYRTSRILTFITHKIIYIYQAIIKKNAIHSSISSNKKQKQTHHTDQYKTIKLIKQTNRSMKKEAEKS